MVADNRVVGECKYCGEQVVFSRTSKKWFRANSEGRWIMQSCPPNIFNEHEPLTAEDLKK